MIGFVIVKASRIRCLQGSLSNIEGKINAMAKTLEELVTEAKADKVAFDTFTANVGASFKVVQDKLAALQAQVDANQPPDLTALTDAVDALDTDINSATVPA